MVLHQQIQNLGGLGFIIVALSILLIGFYIVQFVDLVRNKKINRIVKGLYIIAFIGLPILSSIIYWSVKKRR